MRKIYKHYQINIVKTPEGKYRLFVDDGICNEDFESEGAALLAAQETIDAATEEAREELDDDDEDREFFDY